MSETRNPAQKNIWYPEILAAPKMTGWWLNQPIWKICKSQIASFIIIHFPEKRGEHKKCLSCHHRKWEVIGNNWLPGKPNVLFFQATLPLKPATIALKIGHLAFQVVTLGFTMLQLMWMVVASPPCFMVWTFTHAIRGRFFFACPKKWFNDTVDGKPGKWI